MQQSLTVVVCTHNRAKLLERALASLNRAERPAGWTIEILVIANACRDGTAEFLRGYQAQAATRDWLPLRFAEEPRPGKSQALNLAIGLIGATAAAFVDDDHRVDEGYLQAICAALDRHPDVSLLCGRIVPDWDGSEPPWVHDTGPYRVYPLPVPQFTLGPEPRVVQPGVATPGGGNLCVRTELFQTVGRFSVDLGPIGHNLGGAEDTEWVQRAIAHGTVLRYVPDMLQYHFADSARLTLPYVMRKAFQRTSAVVSVSPDESGGNGVPLFMYRKVISYLASAVFSLGASRRRFYLVRFASALGEIKGVLNRRVRAMTPTSG
jgi:GT2 family glycosyltransferase